MSFDWPTGFKRIFLACTAVALNVNLSLSPCFGWHSRLSVELAVYLMVPWLHLLLNFSRVQGVQLLHRLSEKEGVVSKVLNNAYCQWMKDGAKVSAFIDKQFATTIWYATRYAS